MVLLLKLLYQNYYHYVINCKDTRLENYLFLGSPFKMIGIIALYLIFVYEWGPKFMKNRKPYELKNILIIYNLGQILANLILFCFTAKLFIEHINQLDCVPVNYAKDNQGLHQAKLTYFYYMIKIADLLDTVFFVLRKKHNQITFLHVYHHAIMVFAGYLSTQYFPGGQFGTLGVVNSFVHTVMYFYYFLTAFKPELKQSIWWKKYITQIQIIQFTSIIYFYSLPLFHENCPLPKFWLIVCIIQNTFMLAMFSDFYYTAYIKKSKQKKIVE